MLFLNESAWLGSEFPSKVGGDLMVSFDGLPDEPEVGDSVKSQVESFVSENLKCTRDVDKCTADVNIRSGW